LFRNTTQSIVGLDKSIGEAQQRIAATEAQVQGATRSFAPVKEKVDAIEAREKNLRAAIAKLRSSLQDWIIVHRGLGQNVRDSLKPDIRSLLTTANDIRKIVEDLRSAK
jgi:septal ring factor EnvC (AmiA/AmiB activator)